MPLHHYRCDVCGALIEEYRSIHEGGTARPAWCCDRPARWVVPVVAMDAKEPFQRFDVERLQPVKDPETGQWVQAQVRETIDSVAKARKIEEDSQVRYANGEGEPLRFRVYNQDASNMDRNSFGEAGSIGGRAYDSGKAPQKKPNISTTRHGQTKPRVVTARGAGDTALKAQ